MAAAEFHHLSAAASVRGRGFAHPRFIASDFETLRTMWHAIRARLGSETPEDGQHWMLNAPDQPTHRVLLLRGSMLASIERLAVVGFFGQKRRTVNSSLIHQIDIELMDELRLHPFVLSYSSMELPDGNWGNLVLLQSADGIEAWQQSRRHAYAAREIAPLHYRSIRIHNGELPHGLASDWIIWNATKYYAFGRRGLWRAIRENEPPARDSTDSVMTEL